MINKSRVSFTSADTFPFKLFFNEEVLGSIRKGHIAPVHIQLNPTNRCNHNCSFCSCGRRDKSLEIPWAEMLDIIEKMHRLGTKAMTITGGGEPTLYRDLDRMIEAGFQRGIKIGLVTNGLELQKIGDALERLTWCRISLSDQQAVEEAFLHRLQALQRRFSRIDWSFSYVVTRNFTQGNLEKLIDFVLAHQYSHLRVVSDLLDLEAVPDIGDYLAAFANSHGKLIYQRRKSYTKGSNPCYLSLLKPNIGPDGNIYPCCGVQYAFLQAFLDFPPSMSMGKDIEDIYTNQRFFNGEVCQRCYYDQYNQVIAVLREGVTHAEFI